MHPFMFRCTSLVYSSQFPTDLGGMTDPYGIGHTCAGIRVCQTELSAHSKSYNEEAKNTKRPFIHQANLSALEIVMWFRRSTGVVVYTLCNAYFQPSTEPAIEFGQLYLQNNLWLLGKCNGTGIHKTAAMASISISWYSTHDAVPSLADKILKTEREGHSSSASLSWRMSLRS